MVYRSNEKYRNLHQKTEPKTKKTDAFQLNNGPYLWQPEMVPEMGPKPMCFCRWWGRGENRVRRWWSEGEWGIHFSRNQPKKPRFESSFFFDFELLKCPCELIFKHWAIFQFPHIWVSSFKNYFNVAIMRWNFAWWTNQQLWTDLVLIFHIVISRI